MALSTATLKALMTSMANTSAAEELVNAVNDGKATADALVAQSAMMVAAVIVATDVSQTTDFGDLLTGDKVIMIPATAGNADLITIATDGDLGQAAVVGNIYIAFRAFSAPTASDASASF